MRATVLALILSFVAGPVLAQSSPAPVGKPSDIPTPVSPITVMPPTSKPKVVATWPAAGQEVAPGVLVLKVTFDQPMTPRDFAYGLGSGAETLNCLKTPRLLNDNKTFVLLCTTLPGKTYAISLNKDLTAKVGGGPGAGNGAGAGAAVAFSNLAENHAEPSALTFTTGGGEPITKLRDAIKAAGLGPLDMPVEEAPQLSTAAR